MPPRRDAVIRICSCGRVTDADCAAACVEMTVSAQMSAVRCGENGILIMPSGLCPFAFTTKATAAGIRSHSDDGPARRVTCECTRHPRCRRHEAVTSLDG